MAEAKAFKMIPHCTKDTIQYEMDELVQCKDCIWFHKPDAETKKSCKCNYHGCVTEGDRYCWWGEKDV